MAKKSAKKEESAAPAVVAPPTIEEQVANMQLEIQQLKGALTGAQNALDECVNLLKRKFPYG